MFKQIPCMRKKKVSKKASPAVESSSSSDESSSSSESEEKEAEEEKDVSPKLPQSKVLLLSFVCVFYITYHSVTEKKKNFGK